MKMHQQIRILTIVSILLAFGAMACERLVETIPEQYVGTWTATREDGRWIVEMMEDGRFKATPDIPKAINIPVDSLVGRWSVRGDDTMVWRYDNVVKDYLFGSGTEDANEIVDETEDSFTLIEVDGSRTLFERR